MEQSGGDEDLEVALATGGGNRLFAAMVDIEAGVFPGEEVGEFLRADEFGVAESVKEAVAEEFDGGTEILGGHAVEAAVGSEESVGGKDMEVVDEVVAEGVDSGNGPDATEGESEAGAEGVLEGGVGLLKRNNRQTQTKEHRGICDYFNRDHIYSDTEWFNADGGWIDSIPSDEIG